MAEVNNANHQVAPRRQYLQPFFALNMVAAKDAKAWAVISRRCRVHCLFAFFMGVEDDAKPPTVPSRRCLRLRSALLMGAVNDAKPQAVTMRHSRHPRIALGMGVENDAEPQNVPKRRRPLLTFVKSMAEAFAVPNVPFIPLGSFATHAA